MSKVAIFWDESYLWGITAYKSLVNLGVSFDILKSEDLTDRLNDTYSVILVPGGWASNKKESLGERGIKAIKEFVSRGGSYLGFCGGAGLATSEGIGLLNINRLPTSQRVPSLSGRIGVRISPHPIWNGIDEFVFTIWWPSQFSLNNDISTIAYFNYALDESYSADLKIGEVRKYLDWQSLEQLYGINLNPDKFINSPLLVEGRYGKGKVMLSLIHFDSPSDNNSLTVMKNMLQYLSAGKLIIEEQVKKMLIQDEICDFPHIKEIMDALDDLISFGNHNFLWFWRNEMILAWRRGIRGFECCNLYIMARQLCNLLGTIPSPETQKFIKPLREIRDKLLPFVENLKELLFLERIELQRSPLTSLKTVNHDIEQKRSQLFSRSKSYGGEYKRILMMIDRVLLRLISNVR